MHTKRWYYYYYYSIVTATTAAKDPRHIFYRSQVIAHFVPNCIAMATGVGWQKIGLQRSTAHPQKPSIDAKILQVSLTEAELKLI